MEINHRQGKNKEYAEILNRVREGKHTDADVDQLKERVRPYNHPDLKDISIYIVCKKVECAMCENSGDFELLKNHLDIFLSRIPDQPTIPGLGRAAATNSLLDQVPLVPDLELG